MTEPRYVLAARVLHWLMAAGFVFMWVAGFLMQNVAGDDTPLEDLLRDLHISVGVTFGCLLILRIAIRILCRPPPLPRDISPIERCAAHFGHLAPLLPRPARYRRSAPRR